jgi:predicted  nucleic acid-binding Zn-ribbon protein
MSANDRPELHAFQELETLVRHLGEELAVFRRRAIAAEAQLKDSGHGHAVKSKTAAFGERLTELESENESLRSRLVRAEDRVRQMMDRVRFLRQQLQVHAPSTSAASAAGGR